MAQKAAAANKRRRTMSDEHKAALAEGREQGRVVRRYLEALVSHRPSRGRRRTPDSITKRVGARLLALAAHNPSYVNNHSLTLPFRPGCWLAGLCVMRSRNVSGNAELVSAPVRKEMSALLRSQLTARRSHRVRISRGGVADRWRTSALCLRCRHYGLNQ